MGKKEEEKDETFSVTTKSGKEYTLPVDVETGSVRHALEKFKTGYDDPEVQQARQAAKNRRTSRY